MEIGKRIKSLRENANLTQVELAKTLKINNSTLSQYESGVRVPSDDIKITIANYFDVSLDYLLGRTDDPTPVDKGSESTSTSRNGLGGKTQEEYFMDWFRAQPPARQKEVLFDLAKAVNGQDG